MVALKVIQVQEKQSESIWNHFTIAGSMCSKTRMLQENLIRIVQWGLCNQTPIDKIDSCALMFHRPAILSSDMYIPCHSLVSSQQFSSNRNTWQSTWLARTIIRHMEEYLFGDDTNGVEIHDNHPPWEIFSGPAPSLNNDWQRKLKTESQTINSKS